MDIEEIELYRKLLLAQIEERRAMLAKLPAILLPWTRLGDSNEFRRRDTSGRDHAAVICFHGSWQYRNYVRCWDGAPIWRRPAQNTKECAMHEADKGLTNVRFPKE
jgi:hypothetical protein